MFQKTCNTKCNFVVKLFKIIFRKSDTFFFLKRFLFSVDSTDDFEIFPAGITVDC